MSLNIKYISDDKGNPTAVQVPIRDWLILNENFPVILEYFSLKESLRQSKIIN